MKKDYALNIRSATSDNDWNASDMSDWYETYCAAIAAAEEALEGQEALEAIVTVWENGEIAGESLCMIRENGLIIQRQGGERLWA